MNNRRNLEASLSRRAPVQCQAWQDSVAASPGNASVLPKAPCLSAQRVLLHLSAQQKTTPSPVCGLRLRTRLGICSAFRCGEPKIPGLMHVDTSVELPPRALIPEVLPVRSCENDSENPVLMARTWPQAPADPEQAHEASDGDQHASKAGQEHDGPHLQGSRRLAALARGPRCPSAPSTDAPCSSGTSRRVAGM